MCVGYALNSFSPSCLDGGPRSFVRSFQPNWKVNLKAGTYELYCPVDGHAEEGIRL